MLNKILLSLLFIATNLLAKEYKLDLEESINLALKNNTQLLISKQRIAISQLIYQQSLSGNYPILDFSLNANRKDEATTFDFDAHIKLPDELSQTLALSSALTKDQLANDTNFTNLNQTALAIQNSQLPAQNLSLNSTITAMGRDTAIAKLNLFYPLYTGGKISAIQKQAKTAVAISQKAYIEKKSEIRYKVKKFYYNSMLLAKLKKLSSEAKNTLAFTSKLTYSLYQNGSENIKKTDYLKSKLIVNLSKEIYEDIILREKLAKLALKNLLSLKSSDSLILKQKEFQKPNIDSTKSELIKKALIFNPQINKLKLALNIKNKKIDEIDSQNYPLVGFNADAKKIYNDYEYGFVNKDNENSWNISIGVKWNLFNGFKTKYEKQQAILEKKELQSKEIILSDTLALQVKYAFLQLQNNYKKFNIIKETLEIAKENEDLNFRAYQEDLVKTEDLIEAQISKSLAKSRYLQQLHNFAQINAQLDLIIGKSIEEIQ